VAAETIQCAGLDAPLTLDRDAYGVAHIEAASERDAWFAQGFVAAQDRLWQMEYDRRRAAGRWAEAAGGAGIAADVLARKLNVEAAAKNDISAMSAETLAVFEAYSAGVNAFLASGIPLPPEYELTGITPEPWEPRHSVAVFKIRHVLMGHWPWKMAVGGLIARIGIERFAQLRLLPPVGSSLIVPPGGTIARLFAHADDEIAAAAEHLGFLSEVDGGSNSWVVHGSRTTTGKPVICNDSHRALDVPNAYWQVELSCPEFSVSGATFAGFPAFPHFGFNGLVAWNITHTQADYQDLYIERFEGMEAERYLAPDGWRASERRRETVHVRGAADVNVDCWRTRHGPIVHGDPRSRTAIAIRYTATDGPKPAFESLRPMTRAVSVRDLFEAQRSWVDPVNNLVAADSSGSIGFMVRGELPIRSSTAGRMVPVAGWTGEHEWVGTVPFEQLPRTINPREGFIATANQRVIDGDDPYISTYFAPPARADRLVELMSGDVLLDPETVTSWQGDTLSRPARSWARFLATVGPFRRAAERARAMLGGWDGNETPNSSEATLYALFRRHLLREVFVPIVGEETWAWLTSDITTGTGRIVSGLVSNIVAALSTGASPPGARTWDELLRGALAAAWDQTVATLGDDPGAWRWDARHLTASRHPLSSAFPAVSLDPPRASIGGDADTLQCGGYGLSGRNDFVITNTSVYRQVVDFARPKRASFIIPGGASGDPRSTHFADQLPLWQRHERIPMLRSSPATEITETLRLLPG
jgi:penicillin G amidase